MPSGSRFGSGILRKYEALWQRIPYGREIGCADSKPFKARRELLEMWGIYPSLRGASSSDAPAPFSLERKNVGVKKLRSLTMPLPSSGSL
jgi:hypothetical protein